MEEIIAIGKTFHQACFKCSKESGGCNKVLSRDNYADHDGDPFCKTCYNKLFGAKGFGYGNMLNSYPDNNKAVVKDHWTNQIEFLVI